MPENKKTNVGAKKPRGRKKKTSLQEIPVSEADKIFRRPTQTSGAQKKKKDEHARKRNVIINFRVTPKERDLIKARAEASGLTLQKFLTESCMYQAVLVKGTIKAFKAIDEKMRELSASINRNPNIEDLDPVQMESLRIILEILEKMYLERNTAE